MMKLSINKATMGDVLLFLMLCLLANGCDLLGETVDEPDGQPSDMSMVGMMDMSVAVEEDMSQAEMGSGEMSTQPLCPSPSAEVCDGVDNDCDGEVDEGCRCDFKGVANGVCARGRLSVQGECEQPALYVEQEGEGSCDGVDNDCDGEVDEGCETCNYMESVEGTCLYGRSYLDPKSVEFNLTASADKRLKPLCLPPVFFVLEEDDCALSAGRGDGIDNDCDGEVDEGCSDQVQARVAQAEVCDNFKDDDGNGQVDLFDEACPLPEEPALGRIGVSDSASCWLSEGGDVTCFGAFNHDLLMPPKQLKYTAMTVGSRHGCVLDEQGNATCWGVTAKEAPDSEYVAISAGHYHTCGVTKAGEVECWGCRYKGPCDVPIDLPVVVEVKSGSRHTCAREASGKVHCWGEVLGQKPPEEARFEQITLGKGFTCGLLKETKQPLCWGENSLLPAPVGVSQEDDADKHRFRAYRSLTAMWNNVCGIGLDGKAYCWGYNIYNQSMPPKDTPLVVARAGGFHACGIRKRKDEPVCWGRNELGQLQQNTRSYSMLAKYLDHTCGVTDEGKTIVCWENSGSSVLKFPLNGVKINGTKVHDLAVGQTRGCAIVGGDFVCWTWEGGTEVVVSGVGGYKVDCIKDGCVAVGSSSEDTVYHHGEVPLLNGFKSAVAGAGRSIDHFDFSDSRACVVIDGEGLEVFQNTTERLEPGVRTFSQCAVSAVFTLWEENQSGNTRVRVKGPFSVSNSNVDTRDMQGVQTPLRDASCGPHGCYAVGANGQPQSLGQAGRILKPFEYPEFQATKMLSVTYDNDQLYGPACMLAVSGEVFCW